MGKVILGLVIAEGILIRFFKLGEIPFFSDSFPKSVLVQEALFCMFSAVLLYFIGKIFFNNVRISLLTSFVFSHIPWVVETGRNGNSFNLILLSVLTIFFILLLVIKLSGKFLLKTVVMPVLFLAGIDAILLLFQKPDWLVTSNISYVPIPVFIANIFHLFSPDFLFFTNDSFWHGGNREWGILFLTFAPFLFIGSAGVLKRYFFTVVLWFLLGIILSILNPYFPESFEFYIVIPLFALAIAKGISRLRHLQNYRKRIVIITVLLFVFEYSQFLHIYLVHYPQNTRNYFQSLKKPI